MMHRPEDRPDSGMALFVVLAFLLLVAALIAPLTVSAHVQARVTRNTINETQDRFAIQGVLRLAAISYLQKAREAADSPSVSLPAAIVCTNGNGAALRLAFIDHSGLIDLNAAPKDLVEAGFRALGLGAGAAAGFANAVDRRRAPQAPGAQGEGPTGLPFETVFDLEDLRSTGEALEHSMVYGSARSVFTVHSGEGTVDLSRSLPELRLQLSRFGVDGTDFLVENSARTPALTVEARLTRTRTPLLIASSVFSVEQGDEETRLYPLEPTRLARIGRDADAEGAGDAANAAECGEMVGPVAQRAMFEVLS